MKLIAPRCSAHLSSQMLLAPLPDELEVLASLPFEPLEGSPESAIVAFRQGKKMGISFHPELGMARKCFGGG